MALRAPAVAGSLAKWAFVCNAIQYWESGGAKRSRAWLRRLLAVGLFWQKTILRMYGSSGVHSRIVGEVTRQEPTELPGVPRNPRSDR
jgi:hypothetical protein